MPVAADPVVIADRRSRRIRNAGRTERSAPREGDAPMAGFGRAPARLLRGALSQRPMDPLLPDTGTVRAAHARRHQGGQDASPRRPAYSRARLAAAAGRVRLLASAVGALA